MAKVTDNEGRGIVFQLDDYEYQDISTADFSPSEDASLTESEIGKYCEGGFLVAPNADGAFYAITWRNYHMNGNSVSGLTPKQYNGKADDWIPCRMVKVYATDDGTYPSVATAIMVGFAV